MSEGGSVLAAVTLTGKAYSAILTLEQSQPIQLREKHGGDLEDWWQKKFGFSFDCLTQSEARYLARATNADTIRGRIIASE